MLLTIIAVSVIAVVAFLIFKTNKETQRTPPVELPEVTPPVIVSGIVIGHANYKLKTDPEIFVSVISVLDNVVELEDADGKMDYLPVEQFLLKYEPRRVFYISRE